MRQQKALSCEKPPSVVAWIKRHKHDDTARGDLARDICMDRGARWIQTASGLYGRLIRMQACPACLRTFAKALEAYAALYGQTPALCRVLAKLSRFRTSTDHDGDAHASR